MVTSPRRLKLVSNAGDPDDVLPLRIDVVAAARLYVKALGGTDQAAVICACGNLVRAVRRYNGAVRNRKGER